MESVNLQVRCAARQFAVKECIQRVASEPHACKCHCTGILGIDVDFLCSVCILRTLVGNEEALEVRVTFKSKFITDLWQSVEPC